MREVAEVLLGLADARAREVETAPGERVAELVRGLAVLPGLVERAAEVAALDGLTHCWRTGWQPGDLAQLARRRLPSAATDYLVDLLATDLDRYPASAVAPAWRAQLRGLDAQVWWRPECPHLGQWATRHRLAPAEALTAVIELLAMIRMLPAMSELLPPPGSAGARHAAGRAAAESVDPKILAKVRALLAKAESTEFPEEAESFFGKAQELMSRYALERAVLSRDSDSDNGAAGPGGRRIWLDAPYVSAKSMLINAVASANRSRTVFHEGLGCVTVLGDEVDLAFVEVLSTSLLVHASQAMVAAGGHRDRWGQSRTKSFRQSFLVSYATRIGERLTEADGATAEAVAEKLGDERLLPVLAARGKEVDELFESLFPSLISRRVSVTNGAGWGAGRVAADLADLDLRRAVNG